MDIKNTILWLLLFCSGGLSGQVPSASRQFVYGFSVSAEFHSLNIGAQAAQPNVIVVSAEHLTSAGAGIGIWGQWQVLPVFSIRPALQFTQVTNTIAFAHPDGQTTRSPYTFSDIELPLHFILSDHFQRLPIKALILFGGQLSWNLATSASDAPLQLLPERAGLDIGIGAGFNLGKWIIQPELIYSYGLNNVHDFQNRPFDWAVGRVLRDRLSLRVLVGFEP